MNCEDIIKEYERLNIAIQPLPEHYDSDTYGKMLLLNTNSIDRAITYSTDTELIVGINDII